MKVLYGSDAQCPVVETGGSENATQLQPSFGRGLREHICNHYNKGWTADTVDCTNLVSQALYFGGCPMTDGNVGTDETEWFNCGDPDSFLPDSWGRSHDKRSITWASAPKFARFLELSGRAQRCKIDELMIGDVVQHYSFADGRIHHTMLITALAPSTPSMPATPGLNRIVLLASYHTNDKLNVPLTLLIPSKGENLFWKIFDHVPGTESGRNLSTRDVHILRAAGMSYY
ncbi:MAG: amidase domain-containing protein [Alloacidobacterium sp.]